MSNLLLKPDTSGKSGEYLNITPESAGWDTVSLAAVRLAEGEKYEFALKGEEAVIVVLGGRIDVECGELSWKGLGGRADVFSGLPWSLYLPVNARAMVTAHAGSAEFAVCRCRASRTFAPRVVKPGDFEVETRGGENATRQINNMIMPAFPADRILVVEVYTPSGNWSSYPPHKHDVHNPPGEVDLDEIYFYKISRPEGYAIQRVYTRDGRRDETITVRNNEAVLIPDGYHPVVAAHGYDVYYLNVLGGSARSLAASDDPDYAWVRGAWRTKDPRVPLVV
jgi:5-deoxy-glucuronate isomerase